MTGEPWAIDPAAAADGLKFTSATDRALAILEESTRAGLAAPRGADRGEPGRRPEL